MNQEASRRNCAVWKAKTHFVRDFSTSFRHFAFLIKTQIASESLKKFAKSSNCLHLFSFKHRLAPQNLIERSKTITELLTALRCRVHLVKAFHCDIKFHLRALLLFLLSSSFFFVLIDQLCLESSKEGWTIDFLFVFLLPSHDWLLGTMLFLIERLRASGQRPRRDFIAFLRVSLRFAKISFVPSL